MSTYFPDNSRINLRLKRNQLSSLGKGDRKSKYHAEATVSNTKQKFRD
jgi:hypothetical protein